MENKTLEKVLDVAGSATKLAANLSEAKKESPKPISDDCDNSNNASTGSQNIQIHMDSGKKKEQKPVEKHIHTFPENRPLTTEECELDLKKAQMEHQIRMEQELYFQKSCDREWEHRIELEKKNEKKGKIRRVIGGILVALGIGTVGYGIYTDYRDHKNRPVAQPKLPEPVKTEGTVK